MNISILVIKAVYWWGVMSGLTGGIWLMWWWKRYWRVNGDKSGND